MRLRGDDPHHRARELAAKQMTRLVAVADAAEVVEMLPPAQGLGKVLRPLLLWLIGLAVVAPRPLRWLLGGPRVASALRWFENYVGTELKAGQRTKFDAALVHTWSLNRSGDTLEVDRLLVAAFLADITAAYRFRRYRGMNSLLLLDGADLLDGVDSYLRPKRPRPAARATDFLSLLAERRLKEPHVPLLVIATKQSAPVTPGSAPSVFKPVRLEPFTIEQTRQFLAEWNRLRDSTVESEALVAELQEVTHGHPLAVRLAIQLVQFVFARDQVLPSVRAVFGERLPVDETTTFQDAAVGDYLLLRFFQRIPGAEDMPEREAAREIFARLAAPRVLDRHVIRALLPASWSAGNMRALLAQLSFVSQQGDNFVLHPLLRDLLAQRLREVPEDQPFSHANVHRLLKDRYDSLGQRHQTQPPPSLRPRGATGNRVAGGRGHRDLGAAFPQPDHPPDRRDVRPAVAHPSGTPRRRRTPVRLPRSETRARTQHARVAAGVVAACVHCRRIPVSAALARPQLPAPRRRVPDRRAACLVRRGFLRPGQQLLSALRPLRTPRARRRPRGPAHPDVQNGRSAVRWPERETRPVRLR